MREWVVFSGTGLSSVLGHWVWWRKKILLCFLNPGEAGVAKTAHKGSDLRSEGFFAVWLGQG